MPSFGLLLCCVPLRKKIGLQVVTLLLLLAVHAAAQQEPSFNVHANLVPVPTLVKDGDGNLGPAPPQRARGRLMHALTREPGISLEQSSVRRISWWPQMGW